ncbi:MAG: UvrD-helicase domain-containing protein [Candidatus Babeliales bacterium]
MRTHQTFLDFLKTGLNQEQREAVTHPGPALLIIAGAGSGKTRVITARIAHLILEQGARPEQIIALTFTNKAAQEMKARITQFLPEANHTLPFIGTFHAYCLHLLKTYKHFLSFSFHSILDEEDKKNLIQSILSSHNIDTTITAKQICFAISCYKNKKISFFDQHFIEEIYHLYEAEKRTAHVLDFDDLLVQALSLFKQKAFKETLNARIRHILIDEYQDTNSIQHDFLKKIALTDAKTYAIDSLCAVGDEDQSIYSWRGATPTNMVHFQEDFPQTTVIKVEQNYRSPQLILQAANHLIQHNTLRSIKTLWSQHSTPHKIQLYTFTSEHQETETIITLCKQYAQSHPHYTRAILYRTHFQSRMFEEALVKHGLPYTIIGGIQFYERKEIKDILAYLRLAINPFDRVSFFRAINCPNRGLGNKFQENVKTEWKSQPFLTFYELGTTLLNNTNFSAKQKKTLESFLSLFSSLSSTTFPSVAILKELVQRINYYDYLQKQYVIKEVHERMDNLQELFNAYEHYTDTVSPSLADFLEHITLMQEQMKSKHEDHHNPLLLMSIHAAKGLEFDIVIIVGLEDNLLPNARSHEDPEAIEEERRLLYVALTRTKYRLFLTTCTYRYTFGKIVDHVMSRFIKELPSELINHEIVLPFQSLQSGLTLPTQTKPSLQHHQNTSPSSSSSWKPYKSVKHVTFGIGIIQHVEQKGDKTFLSIRFKSGIKKINANFVTPQ